MGQPEKTKQSGAVASWRRVVAWCNGGMVIWIVNFSREGKILKIPGLGIKDPKTTCKPRTSTICFMKFFIKPRSFCGFIFSLMSLPPIKMSQNELELFLSPGHFLK